MLNPATLKKSFDKVVNKARKKAFVVSMMTLTTLSSFVPDVHAIEKATILKFRELAIEATDLTKDSKVVNPDGSINYKVYEKEKSSLERRFKDLIRQIQRETKRDIENQEWLRAEELISVFYRFIKDLGYDEIADQLWKIRKDIHDDFVSHVDFSRPGVYTIKGSGKIFVITRSSSKDLSIAQDISRLDSSEYLTGLLKIPIATLRGFGQVVSRSIDTKGNTSVVSSLIVFYKDGTIVLLDGKVLSEKDVAGMLESKGKLLPLR